MNRECIGTVIKIGNGYVKLKDYMGSEKTILEAARISYNLPGAIDKDRDLNLLRTLLRLKHKTPFEHCVLSFEIKTDINTRSQMHRHRTSSVNEKSMRYTSFSEEPIEEMFFIPEEFKGDFKEVIELALEKYKKYVKALPSGSTKEDRQKMLRVRELMRGIIPQCMYTKFVYTMNLSNLLHFITIRAKPDAQREIAEYAKVMETMIKFVVPNVYEIFHNEMSSHWW